MDSSSLLKPPVSKRLKAGRVTLAPGEDVGAHATSGREELLFVLEGTVTLHVGGHRTILTVGQAHYVPPETEHNVVNTGESDASYLYVVSLLAEAGAPKPLH